MLESSNKKNVERSFIYQTVVAESFIAITINVNFIVKKLALKS